MNFNLTVIEAFLSHSKGEVISDPAEVAKYVDSDWQGHFVKSAAPAASTTKPAAKGDAAAK
ncbi:hypothetical protein [Janthinobacterium sp. SUN137]|uniref:hypothetical protein n=1 Tax=Janthinobacterium sp. SUN137 TaxID=3014789 RepID=UPI002713AE85|nr:hypothetical protein [Janthinobacterium sp. SUN137]MDO8039504.1 hypothetical protein [Janthinobacterium sp. SUN137]